MLIVAKPGLQPGYKAVLQHW